MIDVVKIRWIGGDRPLHDQHGAILISLLFYLCHDVYLQSPGRVLPKKMGRGVRPASQNPYPIYEQPAG